MKNTKKIACAVAAMICLAGFSFSIHAAGPGPADKKKAEKLYKVGCINIQKVFDTVPEKSAVQTKLQARQKELTGKQSQIEQELSSLISDFSNQKGRLKPVETADFNIRIFNKTKELSDFRDASSKELSDYESELLSPVLSKIQTIIKEISVQYGFSMIIDKSTYVLYVDKELDITDEVIDAIKKAQKEQELEQQHD